MMQILGTLAGGFLAAGAAKIAKGAAKFYVVYLRQHGRDMNARPFHDLAKAVAFQRDLSSNRLASMVIKVGEDGKLDQMNALVKMNGLGDAWIDPALTLPQGENGDPQIMPKHGLIHVQEADAEAYAKLFEPFPSGHRNNAPFYQRNYDSSFQNFELPARLRPEVTFRGKGYNLVDYGGTVE